MGAVVPGSKSANEVWFDVSVGNLHEKDHNTIVLSGIDLVVPLEADLDSDPLHDDEVRLRGEHGLFERTLLASDPDVQHAADSRLLLYRFRAVPPGIYRLSVKIGDRWSDLVIGLVIRKDGVYLGGRKLGGGAPEPAAPPDDPADDESERPGAVSDELDEVMDVNDGHGGGDHD